MKILEKALSFSQESKNPRLLTETALAWSWVDSGKAQEIVAQIDSKENRVKALCGLARQKVKSNPALAAPLLEKASQQAMAIDGLEEKISALRCVAGDLANLDSGKAKAAYQLIFQAAERADSVSGGFSDR